MSGRDACPHCGGTGWAKRYDTEAALAELRQAIREQGIVVLTGDYVRSDAAAILIGETEKALSNWRSPTINKIPFTKRNTRVLYRVSDLAEYLVKYTK